MRLLSPQTSPSFTSKVKEVPELEQFVPLVSPFFTPRRVKEVGGPNRDSDVEIEILSLFLYIFHLSPPHSARCAYAPAHVYAKDMGVKGEKSRHGSFPAQICRRGPREQHPFQTDLLTAVRVLHRAARGRHVGPVEAFGPDSRPTAALRPRLATFRRVAAGGSGGGCLRLGRTSRTRPNVVAHGGTRPSVREGDRP